MLQGDRREESAPADAQPHLPGEIGMVEDDGLDEVGARPQPRFVGLGVDVELDVRRQDRRGLGVHHERELGQPEQVGRAVHAGPVPELAEARVEPAPLLAGVRIADVDERPHLDHGLVGPGQGRPGHAQHGSGGSEAHVRA
jgi:hypothetical protein